MDGAVDGAVESVQFSEFVLLDEIAVCPSALTAKTPRIPPLVSVNGLMTDTVKCTTEPESLLALVSVTVVSFFVTFAAGLAFDPLFGTR